MLDSRDNTSVDATLADDGFFMLQVGQDALESAGGGMNTHVLEGHTDTVISLGFNSQGTHLATGGMDGWFLFSCSHLEMTSSSPVVHRFRNFGDASCLPPTCRADKGVGC